MSWISINNGLPEDSTWNLIFTGSMVTLAFFQENGDDYYWLCHNDANDKDEWDDVTHWMPLPAPPEI